MTRKTTFFDGWSWFKFNNLGLALGTNLKFYTSVAKGLKLIVRKFWGLIPTFVEVTEGKLVGRGGLFAPPPLLSRIKACNFIKKETLTLVFSCEFCGIFKNTFLTEHPRTTASQNYRYFHCLIQSK